jgi:hypothetical protein
MTFFTSLATIERRLRAWLWRRRPFRQRFASVPIAGEAHLGAENLYRAYLDYEGSA